MSFLVDEEGMALADSVRRLVADKIEPLLAGNGERPLPKDVLRQVLAWLAPTGCLGARVPVEAGGHGLTCLQYGLIVEQLPASLAATVIGHESTATRIAMAGTAEQRAAYLPGLLSGELVGASATSEPDVGSDPRSVTARAVRDGDTYLVNGRKLWVTNGSVADVMMLVARIVTDADTTVGRLIVDAAATSFRTREVEALGLRQSHLSEVALADARVPAGNLLGTVGAFHGDLTRT